MPTRLKRFALFVAALIAGAMWTISSPPGSTPDEDFHLGSIWCAWGVEVTGCVEGGKYPDGVAGGNVAVVPALAPTSHQCYFIPQIGGGPNTSAACQDKPENQTQNFRTNSGDYPSGFYSFMRLFVGPDSKQSVIIMRLVSLTICLLMIWGATLLLRPKESVRTLLYVMAVAVPSGWYFMASVNPVGVAAAATVSAFIAAVVVFRSLSRKQRVIAAGALVGYVLIAMASRPDGLYMGLIAVLVALPSIRFSRRYATKYIVLVVVGLLVILAAAGTILFTQVFGIDPAKLLPGDSSVLPPVTNILSLPDWYFGAGSQVFGYNLPYPSWVVAGRAILFGIMLAIAFRRSPWQRWSIVALAFGLGFAVPFELNQLGLPLQSRYLLGLTFVMAACLAVTVHRSAIRLTRGQAFLIASIAAVVYSIAIHEVLRRYVAGADAPGWWLSGSQEWWWNSLPIGPDVIWIIGTLAFGVLIYGLARNAYNMPKQQPEKNDAYESNDVGGDVDEADAVDPLPSERT